MGATRTHKRSEHCEKERLQKRIVVTLDTLLRKKLGLPPVDRFKTLFSNPTPITIEECRAQLEQNICEFDHISECSESDDERA